MEHVAVRRFVYSALAEVDQSHCGFHLAGKAAKMQIFVKTLTGEHFEHRILYAAPGQLFVRWPLTPTCQLA